LGPAGAQRDGAALGVGEQHLEPAALHAQVAVALYDGKGLRRTGLPLGGQRFVGGAGGGRIAGVLRGAGSRSGVPVADLLHGGLLGAVGVDDAVAAEIVVGGALAEVPAVAQGPAAAGVGVPQGLVHVVPDEAALVLGVLLRQTDVAFHAAQAVAHIVHILAEDEGLGRFGFQIVPDLPGSGVHAALHIADTVKGAVVEHTLVVYQPPGVLGVEIVAHGLDVLP